MRHGSRLAAPILDGTNFHHIKTSCIGRWTGWERVSHVGECRCIETLCQSVNQEMDWKMFSRPRPCTLARVPQFAAKDEIAFIEGISTETSDEVLTLPLPAPWPGACVRCFGQSIIAPYQ